MGDLNYTSLGFKCGLEIHQQLEGKKLFCSCPTEIRKDKPGEKPGFEIARRLRASAGEEGRVDAAALHEQKKRKYFIYQGYNDINCAVETDEEPPHTINPDALAAALQAAKMLNCKIIDKIQVMRKTVIDGSNVSGFQRTALIGMNGFIEVDGKKIGIDTVCLEEEACQVVERLADHDVYNLSRLGIPLIEIATAADIKTPEEAREAAAKIGMILRSTGACKRGIGSIRQDVNLSIKGGARVEIKGFQELKSIPKIIDGEVRRHLKLIEKGETLTPEVRKAEEDFTTTFLRPMPGTDRMYPETDIPEITPDTSGIRSIATIEEKISKIKQEDNLSSDMAYKVATQTSEYERYKRDFPNVKKQTLAELFFINIPASMKEAGKTFVFSERDEQFRKLGNALNSQAISSSSIPLIVSDIVEKGDFDLKIYGKLSETELEQEILNLINQKPNSTTQALMGDLMKKYPGRIDGKVAMTLLHKHKKEHK